MDFSEQFECYKQNVLPAMLDVLAENLGVKVSSLRQLGVGFYPANQTWVFAERDHRGKIIGLSLRTLDGKKFMVEGSKRGLIYPYNECAKTGMDRYEAGRCQWVRIAEAGMDCPVCGKPDWCMVSSDYASGPSAVLCSRVEGGSVKPIGESGFLHIVDRKRQTIAQGNVLPDTELPIVIVEGPSDVLAALDLGFVAIGRPGAISGMELLKQMPLAGKEIWIIGENDAGAGEKGVRATLLNLSRISKHITCVMPPEGIKDLRAWCNAKTDLAQENFTYYVKKYGTTNSVDETKIITGKTDYIKLAETFIAGLDTRLIYHRDGWWKYNDGRYQAIPQNMIEAQISQAFRDYEYINEITGATGPLIITEKFIREMRVAIRNLVVCNVSDRTTEPFIISTGEPFDCDHIILFRNGLLDVLTNRLTPHSDDLFTTFTLPYDYDLIARCPDWDRVVPQWFQGDKEKADLLQEWFGYNMVYTNDLEEVLFICGTSGSGKSTTTQALEYLLRGNFVVVDALSISKDIHALAPAVGKYALLINEEGDLNEEKSKKVLTAIKAISGNDPVSIRRMYTIAANGRLFCRITYSSNELPHYTDETLSLFRRLNLLRFNADFTGNPDRGLKKRLRQQLPGIANWAIAGLKRLRNNGGRFTIPAESKTEIDDIKPAASPLRDFIETHLVFDMLADSFVTFRQLFALCVIVCKENEDHFHGPFKTFSGRCCEFVPRLRKQKRQIPHKEWGFWGVHLTDDGRAKLMAAK